MESYTELKKNRKTKRFDSRKNITRHSHFFKGRRLLGKHGGG